jgi:hypothetical protein
LPSRWRRFMERSQCSRSSGCSVRSPPP